MGERIYQGIRDRRGFAEVYVIESFKRRLLKDQLVLYQEPFELDWGYPGEEARNLALTLLADTLEAGDDPLVDGLLDRLHDELVSRLPQEGWQLHQWEILDWIYGRTMRIPVHKLPLDALGGGVQPGVN